MGHQKGTMRDLVDVVYANSTLTQTPILLQ
jgi:hypothetical protein